MTSMINQSLTEVREERNSGTVKSVLAVDTTAKNYSRIRCFDMSAVFSDYLDVHL